MTLLPGEAEAGCGSKSVERVHGIYEQFSLDCAKGDDMPGCIDKQPGCQKCYLKVRRCRLTPS
jgi:hypothetical protein